MAHIETLSTAQLKQAYAESAKSEALLTSIGQKKHAIFYKKQKKAIMALIEEREPIPDIQADDLLKALFS
jgi:hypothetical protein